MNERFIVIALNVHPSRRPISGVDGYGSEPTLATMGYRFEVTDLRGDEDGGPVTMAVCRTLEAATAIKQALNLVHKL